MVWICNQWPFQRGNDNNDCVLLFTEYGRAFGDRKGQFSPITYCHPLRLTLPASTPSFIMPNVASSLPLPLMLMLIYSRFPHWYFFSDSIEAVNFVRSFASEHSQIQNPSIKVSTKGTILGWTLRFAWIWLKVTKGSKLSPELPRNKEIVVPCLARTIITKPHVGLLKIHLFCCFEIWRAWFPIRPAPWVWCAGGDI